MAITLTISASDGRVRFLGNEEFEKNSASDGVRSGLEYGLCGRVSVGFRDAA